MATFSYQHPTFVFDSFLEPDISNNMSGFPQQATIITTEPCFPPMLPAGANECSQENPLLAQIYETSPPHKIGGGTGKQDTNSSPKAAAMAGGDQLVTQTESATEKKRKNGDVKVGRERRGEKERKNNSGVVGNTEERRTKPCAKKQKKVAEENPGDYVHVRARRGQATDSHSLAERVRRAKISVRMKLLQSLVPGCETITGKAQILDEIIKHVQTLQTQVEFLSAKLASETSMFNDFEVDFGINPLAQESLNFHQLPTVLETSSTGGRIQSLDFHQFPEKTPNPDPILLYQEQRSIWNDNGNLLWETDQSPREELAHECAWI